MKIDRPGSLRVMSWNIHGCIDTRGRYRPDDVARMLERMNADILALQEIDTRQGSADDIDVRRIFERRLAAQSVFATTITDAAGSYGHMLLSRFPIDQAEVHSLPQVDKEPRKLIHARVVTGHGTVDVFATHLGFRRREQAVQVDAMAALTADTEHPAVVFGDLNERFRRGAVFRALHPRFHPIHRRATFPSRWPILPLDQIWFRGLQLLHSRICRETGGLSDHLPVMADLQLE